jgi:hypothetical protein
MIGSCVLLVALAVVGCSNAGKIDFTCSDDQGDLDYKIEP